MKHISLVYIPFLLAAAPAAAEDVRSIPLVLHPAAAPSPALKYTLLPELRDTIPGNAVAHYRQAIKYMKRDAPPSHDWVPAMEQWMAVPLKDLPREEVGNFLKPCESMFQEVEAGARSEDCDWELTDKLRKQGVAVSLPDVQEMRSIASLLALRIRYELAEGRPDKAVATLRTGFTVARHVADQPMLITALVGIAVATLMENRVEEVIQQPDAPNLYWALSDLPRPFIDLHKPLQGERVMAYGSFPGLAEAAADLNAKPWTMEQVAQGANFRQLTEVEDLAPLDATDTAALAVLILARHGAAKKRLVAQGRPQELVDAMPHLQVAMLDGFLQYDQLFDDSMKWQSLPFWEAFPGMDMAGKRRVGAFEDGNRPAIPIAQLLLPAVVKVFAGRARIDRRMAAFRCVEALRLYAAAHDGKLPAALGEIKEAPTPSDPVTGKPFDYDLAGDHAHFGCPPFPGQTATNDNTPTYEISIKR